MRKNQSLQSQLHQLLPQGNSDSEKKNPLIKTSLLKVIDNTLVFDNTVYQIRNISTVAVADLTKTYAINTSVPSWYWFLLVLGIILIAFYGLGILILFYVGWLFVQHRNLEKSRTVENYGLSIGMNSGEGVILTSNSKDFVLAIVLSLYKIMNDEETKGLKFNFDKLTIERVEDRSIKIENSYGSAINSGKIIGDVVNNV
jgi:hypothetical protein